MKSIEEQKDSKDSKTRSNYKVEIQYKNSNAKKRKVKTWTSEEDDRLIGLYQQYPKKWGIIASMMTDRNQNQCLHRYRRLSQLGAQKKIWSAEEDQTILSLISKVGKNWKLISQSLVNKSGKQIRERFINKLDPKIKTQDWSQQEDHLIIKCYSEFGSRWSQISKRLPGRPENKIKNRFYSYIQKNYDVKVVEIQEQDSQSKQDDDDKIYEPTFELEKRSSLKQLSMNSKSERNQKVDQKQVSFKKQIIPSIKQLDEIDLLIEKSMCNESQRQIQGKYALQSLIKVDEELLQGREDRYRSVKSLHSNNDIENQNDHFFFIPEML